MERAVKDIKGMTVAELIAALRRMPQNAVVGYTSDYGDYTHTIQFLTIDRVEESEFHQYIAKTAYSDSGYCVREVKEDEDGNTDEVPENSVPVVFLS